MQQKLLRAIPLQQVATANADFREAQTSSRMKKTMRLDITPDVADLAKQTHTQNLTPTDGATTLSIDELLGLFQNAYDATVITNHDGTILFDNIRAREFLYAEKGTLIGANILTLISGADESTIQAVHETLADERFIRISAWCHSVAGTYFPADIAVYRFVSGEIFHLCFFIRDVSDRVRAEEAERTVERDKVMMESIGTVCHHLGQPSTVLLSSLELLKTLIPEDNGECAELINMSLQAAEQVSTLLHELHDLRTYKSKAYADNDAIVALE